MAWTKTNFYLSTIFVTIVLFVSIGIIGTDLSGNDRINLNEKSVDYILEIKGVSSDSGFQAVSDTDSAESNEKQVLDSEDDLQVSDNTDFLSTLYIKKERASSPTSLFQLIYNIPTSILKGLGLPLEPFKHIINILSYFLVITIIITVWVRIIRT